MIVTMRPAAARNNSAEPGFWSGFPPTDPWWLAQPPSSAARVFLMVTCPVRARRSLRRRRRPPAHDSDRRSRRPARFLCANEHMSCGVDRGAGVRYAAGAARLPQLHDAPAPAPERKPPRSEEARQISGLRGSEIEGIARSDPRAGADGWHAADRGRTGDGQGARRAFGARVERARRAAAAHRELRCALRNARAERAVRAHTRIALGRRWLEGGLVRGRRRRNIAARRH